MKSGNVAVPKARKTTKEIHKTEGGVAIPRAQAQAARTSICQDIPALHLSFLSARFT